MSGTDAGDTEVDLTQGGDGKPASVTSGAATPSATPREAKPAMDADSIAFLQKVFACVRSGDAGEVGPLLAHGLPPNLRNEKGDSFIMLAAYHGRHEVARLLLEHGADPELQNDMGQSPLAGAAYKGDLAMVELLLAHGANVDATSPDGKTALMFAAMFNRLAVMETLLAHGADPAAREAKGNDALALAHALGAPDTAQRLTQLAASRAQTSA